MIGTQDNVSQFYEDMEKDNGAYDVKIDDKSTYRLYALHTSVGLTMAQELISILLPSVGAGADGYINSSAFGESQSFSDAAIYLVNQLQKHNINNIVKILLHDAKLNGHPIDYEKHFRANYGVLLTLVEEALTKNFSSFFTHMGMRKKLINSLLTMMNPLSTQQAQESQESSTKEEA